ncbi:exosortase system-associated protein, TIGR04073 family [Methylicorpusculum oleiharenae]|uniref:exosortase system-associated protein, TIGR04073 family n=1 Tax=Methylicorpusculum oleiharenae TaxID=1338687 RepID=UPI00135B698C|nr:exosortase system-associated protein, TIGR04073 family [Methylicorpusculum oleiharenae]MCD2451444.1 exosortase system-associated protein, TIGR04073 family [Methylicorpusculum oleiharenae]
MTKYRRVIVGLSTLGFCSLLNSSVLADTSFRPGGSYGEKIGHKALSGFTNIVSSPLEIPKNVINTTNQSNIFYGLVGGTFKGIVNMGGRIGVGVADLITFPLPTQPIAQPVYIWDDFDADTTYGETYRLDESEQVRKSKPAAIAEKVYAPAPVPSPPVQYNEPYLNNDNTQKLDVIFQDKMMK